MLLRGGTRSGAPGAGSSTGPGSPLWISARLGLGEVGSTPSSLPAQLLQPLVQWLPTAAAHPDAETSRVPALQCSPAAPGSPGPRGHPMYASSSGSTFTITSGLASPAGAEGRALGAALGAPQARPRAPGVRF